VTFCEERETILGGEKKPCALRPLQGGYQPNGKKFSDSTALRRKEVFVLWGKESSRGKKRGPVISGGHELKSKRKPTSEGRGREQWEKE